MKTGPVKNRKVLVIKLGYSETLDSALSLTTSLGDVLRTTVILHFLKDAHVTWLVDEKALPLLEGNSFIDRILIYKTDVIEKLKEEKYDTVINLEKVPEVCSLSDSLDAGEFFGFSLNSKNGVYGKNPGTLRLIELSRDIKEKKKNRECWQKVLASIIGETWQGQEYILGYKPVSRICYDIGFNWTTGNKWKNKSWPRDLWEKLEGMIGNGYTVSWQKGMNSINEYIEWINSCRMVLTADTLGLHLALALKKRVLALFGPTSPHEICFYGCGSFILPESPYGCVPCLKPSCDKERQCMEYIAPEKVRDKIYEEFERNSPSG